MTEILGVTIPESSFLNMKEDEIRKILKEQHETLPNGWKSEHVEAWRKPLKLVRDYKKNIVQRIKGESISQNFTSHEYGRLSHNPDKFPLFYLKSKNWDDDKPSILIVGGVHGYEPSGIFASIEFAEKNEDNNFNYVIFPCLSPWGYEMDHRWNYEAQDPNRGYVVNSDIEECIHFMDAIDTLGKTFLGSIDLHETPDRDITLRIMRASRFGTPLVQDYQNIPQGFYLVVDSYYKSGKDGFIKSINNAVANVVDIAQDKEVLNVPNENGVVYLDIPGLGATWLRENNISRYAATTEVYSTPIGNKKSIEGQLAAIKGLCENLTLEIKS